MVKYASGFASAVSYIRNNLLYNCCRVLSNAMVFFAINIFSAGSMLKDTECKDNFIILMYNLLRKCIQKTCQSLKHLLLGLNITKTVYDYTGL